MTSYVTTLIDETIVNLRLQNVYNIRKTTKNYKLIESTLKRKLKN